MKITTDYLKSINAPVRMIKSFESISELHGIDFNKSTEITVGDSTLYNDIHWLIIESKGMLLINNLTYKDSSGFSEKITYDEKGNALAKTRIRANDKEYTYDLTLFEVNQF